MKQATTLLFTLLPFLVFAGNISGIVKDNKGNILSYSSLLIKGSAKGTTANSKGRYNLMLNDGSYTIVCQHVGYKTVEQTVVVKGNTEFDFILEEQQYKLNDVVVKNGGEDPAYAIIRAAIKKRSYYEDENKKFECQVYIKGQMQLRNYPKKFMGEKVDFEDGDTSKRKMLFLSETVAKYSVNNSDRKIEVLSTKVSGNSNGLGFSSPQIISFYSNIINLGRNLNPRGFISPIASNALNYYKYKFEGSFFENGKEISRIKVIPKRKYEPLFLGYINIIENEWRLQSVKLTVLKEQQMQFLDTLTVEQLYVPLQNTWVIKQQVIEPAGKIFAFDFFGGFLQVYENFDLDPKFSKKFFDNTLIKFYDSTNKKPMSYWDSIRPIPLLDAEAKDYKKKDSLEQARKDPRYLDSLDKVRNKITFSKLVLRGLNFSKEKRKVNISIDPLISLIGINYNPVEGRVSNFSARYFKQYEGRKTLFISPVLRYGYSNRHFNAYVSGNYNYGKKYLNSFSLSGGTRVRQLNNAGPIDPLNNSISTYYWQHSHMKIYEAIFGRAGFSKALGDGFSINLNAQYQDRKPLNNTIDSLKGKALEPNYPEEITNSNFIRHQALTASFNISWRPGTKYAELPDRKIALRSKYPTFNLSVTQGIDGVFGSDVDYTKWRFSVNDNLDFKIGGRFSYSLATGGFINNNKTFIQDYNHFLGNQTAVASRYMGSFQLLPYYQFSNTEKTYFEGHAEYHLNGLLTNKIPFVRTLNCFIVTGANALYINKNAGYYEAFIGVENIFKIIRVDVVKGFYNNGTNTTGIRFSLPLFIKSGGDEN